MTTVGAVVRALLAPAERKQTPEEIIQEEIRRLGIKESAQEKSLWAEAQEEFLQATSLGANPESLQHFFEGNLVRMARSENHYFRAASEYIQDLHSQGLLPFGFRPRESTDLPNAIMTAVANLNKDGMIDYSLVIITSLVPGESALMLTTSATHESYHLERFFYLSSLPEAGQTEEEKFEYMREYSANPLNYWKEEAGAYGYEAEAYILQCGLLGSVYEPNASGQEERAARYIQFDQDSSRQEWIDYIQTVVTRGF